MVLLRNDMYFYLLINLTCKLMTKIILSFVIGYFAFASPVNAKILKWVDSKGVTHYGDKLPPHEAGRDNSVLSDQGIVVKKNDSSAIDRTKKIDKQLVEQNRRDSALLGSYNSEEEIELARNRNTKTDEIAKEALVKHLLSITSLLKKNTQTTINLLKNNKKVSDKLKEESIYNQTQIIKIIDQIVTREKSIDEIRQRFDDDKVRYAELKPRTQSLTDIKLKKKDLRDLEAWRNDAQAKLAKYRDETIYYKRATTQTPAELVAKIQQATDELARAEEEISAAKLAIKSKEQVFSE